MANHKNEGLERFVEIMTSRAVESFVDVWDHVWGCESAGHVFHDPWISFAHLCVVIVFYAAAVSLAINIFRELCHFGSCLFSEEYRHLISLDKAYNEMIQGLRANGEILDQSFVKSIALALPGVPSMRRKKTETEKVTERFRLFLSGLNPEELAELNRDDLENMLDEVRLRLAFRKSKGR